MKKLLHLLTIILAVSQVQACKGDNDMNIPRDKNNALSTGRQVSTTDTMKLKITIGDKKATAILYDNPATKDFIAQLPLTVKMEDFAGKEKIFYPPQKLSTVERKIVSDPETGDINVYAPWGNIAVFYGSYSGSRDLIRIGRITDGIDAFNVPGTLNNVMFELIK